MSVHKRKRSEDSFENFRQKLKLKKIRNAHRLQEKYPRAGKVINEKSLTVKSLREKSAKILGTGLVAGTLLLNVNKAGEGTTSSKDLVNMSKFVEKDKKNSDDKGEKTAQEVFTTALSSLIPSNIRPLYRNEEKVLEKLVSEYTGIGVRATLEGEHLNTVYGKIGVEQHLRRYPGDTLSQHGSRKDQKEGMAPGLGAWGYFAPSRNELTDDLTEKEKWYAVVQTLYLHDWDRRQPFLKDWYKYRKVMIVNTDNGKAVVASIADSGPAAWTGKHYGGSPEVMDYLGGSKYKKGSVLVFFVDDPENEIELGPVDYGEVNMKDLALK